MTLRLKRSCKFTTVLCFSLAAASAPAMKADSMVPVEIHNVTVTYLPSGSPDRMTIAGINFGSVPGTVQLNETAGSFLCRLLNVQKGAQVARSQRRKGHRSPDC